MNVILLSCLKIFFCRICDVSLGTIKTVFVTRGENKKASIFGFFEVLIWYVVVRDALTGEMPVLYTALAYAAGYSAGTFIGGILSDKILDRHILVQVITSKRDPFIPLNLREAGYGISVVDVNASEYADGKYMIIANMEKDSRKSFEEKVRELDPGAFIVVQDSASHLGGYKRPGK